MTFPAFTVPIVLISRTKGAPDALGNDTWATKNTTTDGVFNPGLSSESVQGQDLLISQPAVYLRPGSVVTSIDAVQVMGQVYEVDGSPNDWTNSFTGTKFGVEVKLKRVTG